VSPREDRIPLPIPLLYIATVLIWGTSWYAMELQLVLPGELAILYRFLLATAILLGWCAVTRRSLRFTARNHLFMAAQGLFLFCLNYVLFYWAAAYLVSGLLAVCFSTMTVMNIGFGALLFRQRIDPIVAVGALLGLAGLGLVFWPELANVELSGTVALGLALSLGGTVSASLGNMVSVRHKGAGVPVVEGNAIGMAYGTLFTLIIVLARGLPMRFDGSLSFVGSLVYLSLFASVFGFGCYLTLVQRIGADRAAYTTVLFPLAALAMSTFLENYRWTVAAALGVVLVLAGNLLVLMHRRPLPALPGVPLPATGRSGK
jgi:drug/metabolite transporter (DMT)-like permease